MISDFSNTVQGSGAVRSATPVYIYGCVALALTAPASVAPELHRNCTDFAPGIALRIAPNEGKLVQKEICTAKTGWKRQFITENSENRPKMALAPYCTILHRLCTDFAPTENSVNATYTKV